jgi:NADPH2:quinone reductase
VHPLPLIPGREAAGRIIATHPSVTSLTTPTKTDGTTNTPTASSILHVATPVAYITDAQGAYAKYIAVSVRDIIVLPHGVSTDLAAASLLQGLTALTFVREAAGFGRLPNDGNSSETPEDDVNKEETRHRPWALVHAAAGGTGSLLSQLLTLHGARVIGTVGGAAKRAEAERWSRAHTVTDTSSEPDLAARVREITSGHGVDVIFDGVGRATFDQDIEMIARKGTLVVFGNAVSFSWRG